MRVEWSIVADLGQQPYDILHIQRGALMSEDTTGFSLVEVQSQPNKPLRRDALDTTGFSLVVGPAAKP